MLPDTVLRQCSQFLKESNNSPLLRALPVHGEGFRKIKLRKKNKYSNPVEKYFDIAFKSNYKDLRLRSMIVRGIPPTVLENKTELFYVFPINGYRILYNRQIEDYTSYANAIAPLMTDGDLISDVVEYTYEHNNLHEAIASGAEILIYDIPYYYAIRCSLAENYESLVTDCT